MGERNDRDETSETDNEEETLIIYDEGDVAKGLNQCQNSLIGKLITDKAINVTWIQSVMHNICRKPVGFRVIELDQKVYQFFFNHDLDMKRALKGSPWLFRNSWLVLQKWECNMNPAEVNFDTINIWVQL